MAIEVKDPDQDLQTPTDDGLQVNPVLTEVGEALPDGVFRVGDDLPDERTELFRANGRIYTVPRAVNPRVVFAFMRDIRQKQSQEVAAANLLYAILGDATMDFLADEDLSDDEMKAVMKAVQRHAMAATKNVLGNF